MAKRKTRPPLTKKRQAWAEERGGHTFKGAALQYPAAPMERYRRELQKMITEMTKAYRRELESVFKQYGPADTAMDASLPAQARIILAALQRRFAKLFRDRAPVIADNILNQVDKASATSLHQSLKELSGGLSLKTKTMPPSLAEAMKAAVYENVSLIKSIPQQYHTQIEGDVMRSMQPGANGLQDVYESLRKYEGVTDRRARFIAYDQVRKATSALNLERSKAAGIKKGEWIHSKGSFEPRKKHLHADGMIFDLDNPPAVGDKGQRVMPGTEPGCRCTFRPIVDFGEE